MAVGIIREKTTRYFSIARWGDADLTIEQVKKRLRAEKWMLWMTSTVGILVFSPPRWLPSFMADRETGENAPCSVPARERQILVSDY